MLTARNITFSYDANNSILRDISFFISAKEKVCILGESGSGKSTLLKVIYGQLQSDSGQISFEGKELKGPMHQLIPGHEEIQYVPQNFELDQYITVREIVGKYLSNIDRESKDDRVNQVLKALSIQDLASKKSHELSGGQKQRVAIARAIAKPSKLILLDEPFSQLDASLHIKIREQLMQYLERNDIAVLFTSHRSDDALGYSDKIIFLKEGEIVQTGRPQEVYDSPENEYIAKMFGEVNLISREQIEILNLQQNYFKEKIAIYPEEIKLNPKGTLQGRIKSNRFQGSRYLINLSCSGIQLKSYSPFRLDIDSVVTFDIVGYRWIN